MTDELVKTGFEEEGEEDRPLPSPLETSTEALAIRASQEAYGRVVDALVDLYRTFDKRLRRDLKEEGLERVYGRLKELGATVGVSRMSLPRLADC